ncbi:hypothetical protein ACFL08_03905 [Patescibacteria group bacterium]
MNNPFEEMNPQEKRIQLDDVGFKNLDEIESRITSELDKYEKLLSKEDISKGDRRAYEDNEQFLQDAGLEIDKAREWMKAYPDKTWDDYASMQMKTWHEKSQDNASEKIKTNAKRKYRFYQKLGSRFQEQDIESKDYDRLTSHEKAVKMFKAFERGGGSPDVQEALLRLKDLDEYKARLLKDKMEEVYYFDQNELDWLETEIKCWKRVADGKPAEGETDEEKEEHRKHIGGMTKEEIDRSRENIKKMKML